MLIKPETTSANHSAALPAPAVCGNCDAEERQILHHVRHSGHFRRLCTSCVLRLHPQSFCPTCFQVYPPPPPSAATLGCFKCYSSSHSRCVEAALAPFSPPTPYVCPLCTHPDDPIFKTGAEGCWAIDRDAAKKLLAAATIASASMDKAAAAARAEAERRAKDAASTRRRAKEALEYLAYLLIKEKLRNEEANGNRVNNGTINSSAGYRNGNGNAGSALSRVDGSDQVLVAFNSVGLKENGKMNGGIIAGMDVDGEDISDDDVDLVRALEEQMQHDDEEENSDGQEEHANDNGTHL